MGLDNMLSNAFLGSMNKAYFLFRHYNEDEWSPEKEKKNINMDKNVLAGRIDQLNSVIDSHESIAAGLGNATVYMPGNKPKEVIPTEVKENYAALQVLYNPSSLTMYSRGGQARMNGTVGGAGESSIMMADHPSETTLSVEIYLDDVNINDAFMGDAFNLGLTAGNVVQKVKSAGHIHSVQRYSELFIAAMTRSISMMVGFVWNKMFFWGELTSVDLTYLMFNNEGNPIRSKINVTIRQDMPESGKNGFVEHYASEAHWEKAFYDMFDTKLSGNEFGVTNKASNIIGL